MLYPAPLSKDHKILEQEFCSGYIDSFGKWNTGFYCPQIESTTAVYCCGTPTFKYCCTMRLEGEDEPGEHARFFFRTPVMVGIIAGITLVLLFITIASCYFCSCCFVYKKRRAHLTGGLYRMQCSSTASGLMYSPSSASNHGSLVTTPLDSDGWNPQGQLFSTSTGAANCQNQIVNQNGPRAFLPLQNGYLHHHPTATSIATLRNQRMQPRFASNNNNNINGQHNLPPPVFYPPSHLATTITSGTPNSRASSISSSGFPTRSSSLLNGDVPRFTTLSSLSPYRPQNQYHTQPRLNNYANRRTLETIGGGSRPSYLTTFGNPHNVIAGQQQQQRRPQSAITSPLGNGNGPPFGFCTLPRQQGRQPGGLNIATRPALTEGRDEDAVTSAATAAASGPTIAVQGPSENQASGEDTRADNNTESTANLLNRSNIQRLASCLSSSDSMHQALNASVL